MTRRSYVSVADWRAPFNSAVVSGLGDEESLRFRPETYMTAWPRGRGYWDVSHYRAPYEDGYFQSNALFGLGALAVPPGTQLPPRIASYLRTGHYSTLPRDLGALTNQIPRWAYAALGGLALIGAWRAYRRSR